MLGKKISEVSNAVIIIDDEGIIYKINAVAARMFGYSEAELIGQSVSIILPFIHKNRLLVPLSPVKKTTI